jgi:hypothetical protein
MSKDKQIEEMARDIGWSRCTDCLAVDSCSECSVGVANECVFKEIAEDLCKKGYRKVPEGAMILTRGELDALNKYQERFKGQDAEAVIASKVAREIFAEIEKRGRKVQSSDFSGEFWSRGVLLSDIAEFKKKYTVTDTNVGCKESEVAKRREDIEKSPVDSLTPSVTDSKGERNELY